MKTRILIPIPLGAVGLVFLVLFYVTANDESPVFPS